MTSGCVGVHALCRVGYLAACQSLVTSCAGGVAEACMSDVPADATVAPAPAADEAFVELDAIRNRGEDAEAVTRLRDARGRGATPRMRASLGLALQGAERFLAAEVLLTEVLEVEGDGWIDANRAALTMALAHTSRELGWAVVDCGPTQTEIVVVGDDAPPPTACGVPVRLPLGDVIVEVRGRGMRSERRAVHVGEEVVHTTVALAPFACEAPEMTHSGGEQGGCCWSGQTWRIDDQRCDGAPDCPVGTTSDGTTCVATASAGSTDLARFHVGVTGGVTGFIDRDGSLFRPTFAEGTDSGSIDLGARVELRGGARIAGPFGFQVVVGGTMQGTSGWLDCAPGTAGCGDVIATDSYQLDVGLLATVHTAPERRTGAFDLHFAAGVRPYAHLVLGASGFAEGPTKITAVTIPVELGIDLFLSRGFSVGLIVSGDVWLPWKLCGPTATGSACSGFSELEPEVSWSGLFGMTLHFGE